MNGLPGSTARALGRLIVYLAVTLPLMPVQALFLALNSPLALRLLKAGFNADSDGLAGVQQLAGDATLLYYMSEEAQEGRDAYKGKRRPDFSRFPKRP